MKKSLHLGLISLALSSLLYGADETREERAHSVKKAVQNITKTEQKEIEKTEDFNNIINIGKVSGQFRTIYSAYNNKNSTNTYATAIGGMLMYETAEFYGLSGAVAMTTTNDIRALSGEGDKHNDGLSGADRSYTVLSHAYLNYQYKDFDMRLGRQNLGTPLADSDDSRMVANTFEAYVAHYKLQKIHFTLGYFDRWQGVDANVDDSWVKAGKDGVHFAGVAYESKNFNINTWYYEFSNPSDIDIINGAEALGNRSIYLDTRFYYDFRTGFFLHLNAQYLRQKNLDNSLIESDIYGLMAEVVYNGFGFRVAYNEAKREAGKQSFSGYGNGALYTGLDTAVLDDITFDRSAYATVGILSYTLKNINLLYAYGLFKGDADSQGVKAKIVEQNFGLEYNYNDALTLGMIYVIDRNKEDSSSLDYNDDNFRLLFAYNF